MDTKITDIFGKFRSEDEKNDFIAAQWATINTLNRQLEQLKAEKKQLEELLKEQTPVIAQLPEADPLSEELRICLDQLRMLKSVSKDRELTMEECRKVEIYSKIREQGKSGTKKQKSAIDGMDTEQLLKLVADDESAKPS